jgi:hypothetical protein
MENNEKIYSNTDEFLNDEEFKNSSVLEINKNETIDYNKNLDLLENNNENIEKKELSGIDIFFNVLIKLILFCVIII